MTTFLEEKLKEFRYNFRGTNYPDSVGDNVYFSELEDFLTSSIKQAVEAMVVENIKSSTTFHYNESSAYTDGYITARLAQLEIKKKLIGK